MKSIFKVLFFVLFTLLIISCKKELNASFTTDKTEYYQGETVHLTNTTENGNTYLWTMPNEQTLTAENADYIIDAKQKPGAITFKLAAFSKREKQTDTISKTVNVKYLQTIMPKLADNSFSVDGVVYSLGQGSSSGNLTNNTWIKSVVFPQGEGSTTATVYLPGRYENATSGIYSLQSDPNSLNSGTASVIIDKYIDPRLGQNSPKHYKSLSGQIELTIISTLKTRVVFNEVDAKDDNTNTMVKISGNILGY